MTNALARIAQAQHAQVARRLGKTIWYLPGYNDLSLRVRATASELPASLIQLDVIETGFGLPSDLKTAFIEGNAPNGEQRTNRVFFIKACDLPSAPTEDDRIVLLATGINYTVVTGTPVGELSGDQVIYQVLCRELPE